MNLYEIFRLDEPTKVIDILRARSPEDALEQEASIDPACILDTTLLTLINRHGALGARLAKG
ncbi:MAG: hypothetical protein BWY85_00221 [Firmicutes bacterium ADurb.Bin506]|nr:MAG: hypothetical protein BWY85_00221 [Firmicutes bacterium ADurb.Bin506]